MVYHMHSWSNSAAGTAFCVLILLGPCLLGVGIYFLVSALHDTRGDSIHKFNNAIDDWDSTYRAQFQSLNIYVYNSSFSQYLPINQSIDALNDKDEKLKTYTPLKYAVPLNAVLAPKTWKSSNTTQLSFSVNNISFWSSNLVLMQPMQISTPCEHTDIQCLQCTNQYGTWDFHTSKCTGNSALTSYCIKLSLSSNGSTWSPSPSPGGNIGCGKEKTSWNPQIYTVQNPTSLYSFNSGYFIIRSIHDPYIIAAELTSGTYNFGYTQGKNAIIGIICTIIGSLVSIPCGLCTCVFIGEWHKKRKYNMFD